MDTQHQKEPTVQNTGTVNVAVHNNDTHHGILEKNWTVALVLSIFRGMFGIDRFYLGEVGLGILKLLTFGACGLWWIIDIIMIATKSVKGVRWV